MRFSAIILFMFISAGITFSQETMNAQVMEIAGKVEYRVGEGNWRPARIGDTLPRGTIVSTGFKSTALLLVGESQISVKPVTRLSLEELVRTQGGTQTQLFLRAGRVAVEVPPRTDRRTEFSVRSPTATASVRGTGFEFDGLNLLVRHGVVELANPWGQFRYVGEGEYSYLEVDGAVSIPLAVDPESGLEKLDELGEQRYLDQQADSTDINTGLGGAVPTATISIQPQ